MQPSRPPPLLQQLRCQQMRLPPLLLLHQCQQMLLLQLLQWMLQLPQPQCLQRLPQRQLQWMQQLQWMLLLLLCQPARQLPALSLLPDDVICSLQKYGPSCLWLTVPGLSFGTL
jgi:hypothetical protein